jgi:hypothetical protein
MDLQVGDMLNEIARELHQNGTPILLQWNAVIQGATPDPVDGSLPAAALVARSKTLPAFVHQVQDAGRSSVRQFNEVEVGDLILDFPGDAALPEVGSQRSEVRDLVFVVNGKPYVAKQIGEKLAQTWDVTVQGKQLFRTVLVRVAT